MSNNEPKFLIIKGAKQHNLKNITVSIPRNKLTVFTGLSGSGKSSLALDTIYAEGQRRYVESLSSYARQFLGVMDKPDVESIEGLSPAIAISQKTTTHNPRSTVGTVTETYDFLRLLFARIGHPHCPNCGREISQQTKEQMIDQILKLASGSGQLTTNKRGMRVLILSPLIKDRKGEYSKLFSELRKKGFLQIRLDREIRSLEEDLVLIKTNRHTIEAVVDKIVIAKDSNMDELKNRLSQSLETGLKLGEGNIIISEVKDSSFTFPDSPKNLEDHLFSQHFACPFCNISLPALEPRNFSFNSPHGACPSCTGLGTTLHIDPSLIISPNLSIGEGGILPWSKLIAHDTWYSRIVEKICQEHDISLKTPLAEIPQEKLNLLLYGTGDKIIEVSGENRFGRMRTFDTTFEGVIPNLERRYQQTDSEYIRSEIERFMRLDPCFECQGKRLKKESLAVTIDQKNIIEVANFSIEVLIAWINTLYHQNSQELSSRESQIAQPIFKELSVRLSFLVEVGLEYLTLDRSANTLAGGEAQRIQLASQIGSGLTGVLYILDEPTIGLHARDNNRLIKTLHHLRDLGNTVIVVEHDREMMENADWILDFGPGAGDKGGEIVAQGTFSEIVKNNNSLTGKYLSGKKEIQISVIPDKNVKSQKTSTYLSVQTNSAQKDKPFLTLYGCQEHNLKNLDVSFPLGKLIAVTGVSGSGKSSLISDTLWLSLHTYFSQGMVKERPGKHTKIEGLNHLDKAINVDQSPIGRTPRSNPATYTGLFTYIRDLFAKTFEAKARGYEPGQFSFNVKGGRCEACLGEGMIKIEMQFLPDVYVLCEVCRGTRFSHETLEIEYKEKNIAQILEMTVDEALDFFHAIPVIYAKLKVLQDVGLGYIRLGQPAPTLSGGEAQRVKLATELSRRQTGKTLYMLDEPTTGLHFADIEKLLFVLKRLVEKGNTVIIIEHNLDVIKNADWILDLGPEGGEKGGYLIASGAPKEIAQNSKSYTGQYLKKLFN